MKNFIMLICLVMLSVVFAQEALIKEEILCPKEILQQQEATLQQQAKNATFQEINVREDFGKEREFNDFCDRIFEPVREPLLDDFSPPEQQVFEQEQLDSFFTNATSQNEDEFTDVRIKNLSKMDFIERRVIERSFDSFLKKQLETNMTSQKKSVFKRLTAEIKKINQNKDSRIVKNNGKTSVVQANQESTK